jgi:hypothetical protein
MSTYKGRTTYAKGTFVEFVVAPDQDVDFGDILVVEGKNGDRFYIRVYDFKVKSRWSNMNGVNYLMGKLDEHGQIPNREEFEFYLGGPQHKSKVAMAEQLCYADSDACLFNPRTCPDFFDEVRSLSDADATLLGEIKGDLEIGFLKTGREVSNMPIGIYGHKAITEHIGIFGTTGAGKSNLVKVLTSSVMDQDDYSLLIFDVHNEYLSALRKHPRAGEKLIVYNNYPLYQTTYQLSLNAQEIMPDDLMSTAGFTEAQTDALYKMESVWGEEWFNYCIQYDVHDLIDELEGSTGQKFHTRTISKIKSLCWNLRNELNINDQGGAEAIQHILGQLESGKVVLVELKNVSPLGEQALSTLLSKKLLAHYAGKTEERLAKATPVMIVLEEAHRFLGKKEQANANVFARLVSEARKFNLGLCAVDQQPRLLADNVLSQLNTLFIMGLASKADRGKLEAMCRKDILQQRNEIKNLDRGEMIIATNYMRFAAPVKVHKYEDYVTGRVGGLRAVEMDTLAIGPVVNG